MNLLDLIGQPFLLRAVGAAMLLGISCGLLSFFVVQRGLAFMGHGVAHSMVAGVGLGILLGWPVFWPALLMAVFVSLSVGWIARRGQVSEDSAIGITLSAALALGLVLISLKQGYISNLESYLFGSLVAVGTSDLFWFALLAAIVASVTIWAWKPLLLFSFDPEGAAVAGYPVERMRYGLLVTLAVLIAFSMKIVGILLVGAFLVVPAAAAGFWSVRASIVVGLSVGFALVAALGGLAFSVGANVPAGAAIVLNLVALFAVGRLLGPYRRL